MNDFFSWGGPLYSELRATPDGECIDISYVNTITPYDTSLIDTILLDQRVIVSLGGWEVPDQFSVVAAPGWEVVTTSPLMVEEWTTAIIRVCQMLLG